MAGQVWSNCCRLPVRHSGFLWRPPVPLRLPELFLDRRDLSEAQEQHHRDHGGSQAPETKRSLLRKDVNEFDKLCGEGYPDARTIFHAAVAVDIWCLRRPRAGMPPRRTPLPPRLPPSGSRIVSPLAAPIGRRVRCAGRQGALWLGCAGSPAVPVLGAPLQRIHDFGHVAAAARYGLERADDASGLVRAAGGDQRSDRNAEPTSERRVLRVPSTRGGSGPLWAEIAPASCS